MLFLGGQVRGVPAKFQAEGGALSSVLKLALCGSPRQPGPQRSLWLLEVPLGDPVLLELGSSPAPGSSVRPAESRAELGASRPRTWSHGLTFLGAELPGTLCASLRPTSLTPRLYPQGTEGRPSARTCSALPGSPRARGERRRGLLRERAEGPSFSAPAARAPLLKRWECCAPVESTSKRRPTAATARPQVRLPHPPPSLP